MYTYQDISTKRTIQAYTRYWSLEYVTSRSMHRPGCDDTIQSRETVSLSLNSLNSLNPFLFSNKAWVDVTDCSRPHERHRQNGWWLRLLIGRARGYPLVSSRSQQLSRVPEPIFQVPQEVYRRTPPSAEMGKLIQPRNITSPTSSCCTSHRKHPN